MAAYGRANGVHRTKVFCNLYAPPLRKDVMVLTTHVMMQSVFSVAARRRRLHGPRRYRAPGRCYEWIRLSHSTILALCASNGWLSVEEKAVYGKRWPSRRFAFMARFWPLENSLTGGIERAKGDP
jgi:hypothetical protein